MLTNTPIRPDYDVPTAVTFLFAGLALGAILTVLFSPLRNDTVARASKRQPRRPVAIAVESD
jgi:hypothetical protein